jgi:thioredoxin reductase (NADPH)
VASYARKLKFILTGFAEVATAAHAMYSRVRPGEALHFEHSTTKGIPGESTQHLQSATSKSTWGG